MTEQQQQDLTLWSNQVVSAHVPEAREKAIRSLAAVKNQEVDSGSRLRARATTKLQTGLPPSPRSIH